MANKSSFLSFCCWNCYPFILGLFLFFSTLWRLLLFSSLNLLYFNFFLLLLLLFSFFYGFCLLFFLYFTNDLRLFLILFRFWDNNLFFLFFLNLDILLFHLLFFYLLLNLFSLMVLSFSSLCPLRPWFYLFCLFVFLSIPSFFSLFFTLFFFVMMRSFMFFVIVLIFFMLGKFFRNITNTSPVFYNLFMLSSHFNKKSSSQNFSIKAISYKVNGINFHLEYDLKRAWIVILNLDKFILRKSFFNILFSSIKVTLNKVEWNMLNIIIKGFNLFNDLLSFGVIELLLLVLSVHRGHRFNYN